MNKVILPNQLALRVAALDDKTEYRQKPAYNHDKRMYGAVQFDPKFLSRGSAHTSLRLNYEDGQIDANRPRITPPVDAITPWFTSMNRKTYSATTVAETNPALIAADPTRIGALNRLISGTLNPNYQPWIDGGAGGQIFDQPVAVFGDAFSSNQVGTSAIAAPARAKVRRARLQRSVGLTVGPGRVRIGSGPSRRIRWPRPAPAGPAAAP